MNVSNDVRKTVLFHNVVIQNLQEKYVGLKSRCAKKNFQNFFESQTLKKYKMLTMCRSAFGFSVKNRGTHAKLMSKTTDFCTILKREISQFYVRDDVSRTTAGKKETITRNKMKMQKRFVLDTLENLHRKFRSENPTVSVIFVVLSLASFLGIAARFEIA